MQSQSIDAVIKEESTLEELELGEGLVWLEYLEHGQDWLVFVPVSTECHVGAPVPVSPQITPLARISDMYLGEVT